MSERPLIGITGPHEGALGPRACAWLGVRLAGGRPRQLRPGDPLDTAPLDGVVIGGGHDVEPALYKAAAEVQGNYDPERDRFESDIIDRALADGTPILGICRGAQLLNVRLGGTLIQDLRQRREITSNRRTIFPLKTLCIAGGSRLAELLGFEADIADGTTECGRIRINSLHNQSIDELGEGLIVSGRDLDGIVQAVEDPDAGFRLGVQWHPEFLLYSSRQRALFAGLVTAARAYRDRVRR